MLRRKTPIAASIALAAGLALAACGGSNSSASEPAEPTAEPSSQPATGDDPAQAAAGDEEAASADAHAEKRARCVRAIEHVLSLIEERGVELTAEQRDEALGDGADECAAGATRAELDCVLSAGALEEVRSCEGSS